MRLRLGTRGSDLARTQSGLVADALAGLGHEVEVVTIRSEGDATTGSLVEAGGLGVFAASLRRALLAGEVDLAVHSLKDLPTADVDGLVVAAIPPRADAADALCARDGHTLASLPAGARIGTGSPRRAAQLRARRPDITVVEIRGNVGTRLARALGSTTTRPDLDAVVLARAGLDRLGRLDAITETLGLLPAPGQGALAVECRADDEATRAALAPLDDPDTRAAVTAERALLAALEAGCAAPVGALATVVAGRLSLTAAVLATDGLRSVLRQSESGLDDAEHLGRSVAADLLAGGARDITTLGASRDSRISDFHARALWAPGAHPALAGRRILLPRAEGPLADALRGAGAEVDAIPITRRRPLPFARPSRADWVVITSPYGVRTLRDAGVRLPALGQRTAAIGPATADALLDAGVTPDLLSAPPHDAAALVRAFPEGSGTVLVPGSALSSPTLAEGLRAKGWRVTTVATYTTEPLDEAPGAVAGRWRSYDAVVLTAGSTARAAATLLGTPAGHTRVVALGRPTAEATRLAGWPVHAVAGTPDAPGLIAALAAALEEPA